MPSTEIDTNPLLAIFGLAAEVNLSVMSQNALAFTSLLARRLIHLKCEHVSPPPIDTWLKEVTVTHWFFKDPWQGVAPLFRLSAG